ncbi:MAG: monovalent cation/H+ antiporter subunit D family protein [Candidatus Desulfofervidaceae bacterium]|nr:monovalent cation/H+ antiporter subunit D family protein [Candidatus Desulfofervidaceae bacterium]
MLSKHLPVLIVTVPLMTSFLVVIIGLWKRKVCYHVAFLASLASFVFSAMLLQKVILHGTVRYYQGGWLPPWGIEYVVDHLNAVMLVLVSFVSFMALWSSGPSAEKEIPKEKIPYFYTLYLLQIAGLLGIVVTGDMFNLYVFLEIASLSGYALIAMGEKHAPMASFNYVIMGTIGACFYLLSVGYLYIVTGSLNMADLAKLLPHLYTSKVVITAFIFFIVGISLKMALFPLHIWLPDAYTLAPSSVSSLVAPTMTKVGAYAMFRVIFSVFQPHFSFKIMPIAHDILGWLAAAAVIFGSIMALAQNDFKRMLTYVLIAEVGYIVIGVAVANQMALTGAILHIINDAFMMSCLFLVAGAIVYKTGNRNIYRFRFLHKKMPLTMAVLVVGALSVIGVPPLCGFFSKWYLILGALAAHKWLFIIVILLSTLFNAVLFFRVIENAYLEPREPAYAHDGGEPEIITMDEAPLSMLLPMFLVASGIILVGVFSGQIIASIIKFAIPANI